jgi:carbon storage regulator
MLALSRKKGESIIFNNDIEVTILDIRGEQIKIGITAPSDVSIYRKEVYLQIQEENKEAAENTDAVAQLENLLK